MKRLSGGLLCSWDKFEYKMKDAGLKENMIWCIMNSLKDRKDLCIINIYSPQELWNKKLLWMEISKLLSSVVDIPCCIIGDINAIRMDTEKEKCVYRRNDMEGFNDFISKNNLTDLAMINAKFTWFGQKNNRSRLDRALVNSEWFAEGQWSLKALNRNFFDHCGLLMTLDKNDYGPKSFRVYN